MNKSTSWVWQFYSKKVKNIIYQTKAECDDANLRTMPDGQSAEVMLVPERLPESELDVLMSSTDPELQLMAKAFYRLAENHILGDSK